MEEWKRQETTCKSKIKEIHGQIVHSKKQILELKQKIKILEKEHSTTIQAHRALVCVTKHPLYKVLHTTLPKSLLDLCSQYSSFQVCLLCNDYHPKFSLKFIFNFCNMFSSKMRKNRVLNFDLSKTVIMENDQLTFADEECNDNWNFLVEMLQKRKKSEYYFDVNVQKFAISKIIVQNDGRIIFIRVNGEGIIVANVRQIPKVNLLKKRKRKED